MKIKRETIKNAGSLIVGIGVSAIVGNIIKENTSEEKGTFKKFCIWTAGLVLTGMACSKASNYFDRTVDRIADGFKPKEVVEEKKEETV